MSRHFNGLSPANDELLALLSEECAEVIQEICKAQRHGLESCNPFDSAAEPNWSRISREMWQVLAAMDLLIEHGVLDGDTVTTGRAEKLRRIGEYLHHAKVPKRLR